MRKQSVVMVILLILAISLMGVVSASDDMADDVDSGSFEDTSFDSSDASFDSGDTGSFDGGGDSIEW